MVDGGVAISVIRLVGIACRVIGRCRFVLSIIFLSCTHSLKIFNSRVATSRFISSMGVRNSCLVLISLGLSNELN